LGKVWFSVVKSKASEALDWTAFRDFRPNPRWFHLHLLPAQAKQKQNKNGFTLPEAISSYPPLPPFPCL
jgi:hypothetical protein